MSTILLIICDKEPTFLTYSLHLELNRKRKKKKRKKHEEKIMYFSPGHFGIGGFLPFSFLQNFPSTSFSHILFLKEPFFFFLLKYHTI